MRFTQRTRPATVKVVPLFDPPPAPVCTFDGSAWHCLSPLVSPDPRLIGVHFDWFTATGTAGGSVLGLLLGAPVTLAGAGDEPVTVRAYWITTGDTIVSDPSPFVRFTP